MTALSPRQPTPVTILTGFLGAGKTTLLNRILQGAHGLRIAVMVNDFGAINIDSDLIVGVEGESVSLANGCICCTIRDDLLVATLQLLQRPEPPDYILIEASGVSDPIAIADTFALPELQPLLQLDGIITLVDAEQVREFTDFNDLIIDQIEAADIVVLNKIDLVSPEKQAELQEWIQLIVPRARVVTAQFAEVPLELLLGVGRYQDALELDQATAHHDHGHDHDHHHDDSFDSWSYVSEQPLSLRAVRNMLKTLPLSIVRAKGKFFVQEAPNHQIVFHLVGNRLSLAAGELWGDATPMTQVVAIGAKNSIQADELTARFDACRVPEAANPVMAATWEWIRKHQTP